VVESERISVPRWFVWLALVLILFGAAFVRIRLVNFPLERDEGEYAYAGQLMLHGIPPYKLAYNMKLPGTYAAYAVIMALFGQTIAGIHTGLLLVNAFTTLLVFRLAKDLFGVLAGLAAAAVFALLSLSDSVDGLEAHATHFVTLFGVAGALLLWHATDKQSKGPIFWSGILFGLSFVMKQQGIFFGLFGGLMLVWQQWQRRPLLLPSLLSACITFMAGMALPFVAVCATLALTGVFSRFWFWTFDYGRQYAALVPVARGWINFKNTIGLLFVAAPGIWLLAMVGFGLVWSRIEDRKKRLFAFGLFVAGFATACPGLYFREHYFVPLLPAVAIFAGAAMQISFDLIGAESRFKAWAILPLIAFLAAYGQSVFHHRALFFELTPNMAARQVYGMNPFPEAVEIARYIREHSGPDSRIAVLGSEPEIYFYAGRYSATGYIYTYPLMEPHPYALTMQREMISEIERAQPEFIVFVDVPWSWLGRPDSHHEIFEWFETYGPRHYQSIGLVDIQSADRTTYRWDEKAVAAIPRSSTYVRIFKRSDLF
jgi:hypothetical protein